MSNYKIVTQPAVEPLTVQEVKTYTRITQALQDNLIGSWIKTGRELIEQHLRRVLITQTIDLVFDGYPSTVFEIPNPPLQSVTSIKYYDTSDIEYTFSSSNYFVSTFDVGRVALNYNVLWPTTLLRPIDSVAVRYVAGYGDSASDVPQRIKDALYLYCAYRNDNRTGENEKIPDAFYNLLNYAFVASGE